MFARHKVPRGEVTEVHLKVSETVTHRPAHIPVTLVRGVADGPTLFVTAAVHGDEINGTAIVRRLLDVIEPEDLKGTLIGVPVVNRFGFASGDRYLPDRRDLNRFFPGRPDGSMASRIAYHLFHKIIKISDAGIDLHTAATGRSNLCHIRGNAADDEVRDLMRAFGTPVMIDTEGDRGTLRRTASEAGVPTALFEAGEPNRFQSHVVEIGYEGILRVMRHMGMIKKRVRRPGVQVLVKSSEWVRADHGGLVDLMVEPGDLVRARQKLGVIRDPFGRHVDRIIAPHGGVVLSTATTPLANPGSALVHLGKLERTMPAVRDYVKRGGDLGHVNWGVSTVKPRNRSSSKSGGKVARSAKTKGPKASAKEASAGKASTKTASKKKGPRKQPSKKGTSKKKAAGKRSDGAGATTSRSSGKGGAAKKSSGKGGAAKKSSGKGGAAKKSSGKGGAAKRSKGSGSPGAKKRASAKKSGKP